MKTQYYAAASLDGYIATEDHSLDWLDQFGSGDDGSYPAFIREVGALAMGSATYEWIVDHLSRAEEQADEDGSVWPYAQPAWVFSSRALPAWPDADVRFVSGDVRSVHDEMRKTAGEANIWLAGGGDLVAQFLDAGLLDEIIVQVAPVLLGGGRPFLPRSLVKPPLRLQSVERYGGALVELRYAVAS